MTDQHTDRTSRPEIMPKVVEEDGKTKIRLFGVGPECPECGGPTHRVAENRFERPWWCADCSLRVDGDGNT